VRTDEISDNLHPDFDLVKVLLKIGGRAVSSRSDRVEAKKIRCVGR